MLFIFTFAFFSYALRYESERGNQTERFTELLTAAAAGNDRNRSRVRAVSEIIRVSGVRARGGDLFGNKSVWSRVGSLIDNNLRGIENVFTRHKPVLSETVELLAKNKLRAREFPLAEGSIPDRGSADFVARPSVVYVYMLGGATYEESAAMAVVNKGAKEYNGIKVVLGGSCVHNSESYLDDLLQEEGKYAGNRNAAGAVAGSVGGAGSDLAASGAIEGSDGSITISIN